MVMWIMVIVILVILSLVVIAIITTGNSIFKCKIYYEAQKILVKRSTLERKIVTEEDLEGLPEPVSGYLRCMQIVGKEKIRTCRLKQRGLIRTQPNQGWMPFTAEEYFTVEPPAFLWHAKARFALLPLLHSRDMYTEGKGNMLITFLSMIQVVNAHGKELDQGALLRFLGEIVWFPSAFLSNYIEWEAIDSSRARATITSGEESASALFRFDKEDEIVELTAERYLSMNGHYSLDTWSTLLKDYKEINGIRVPTLVEAMWKLESGEFRYFKCRLTRIDYNKHYLY
jgi:hypothetical protein